MFGLTKTEIKILKKLSTPIKIQDFLDKMPMNHEKNGETYLSPRLSLKRRKMHCLEGALVAATALWLRGEKPLLFDLKCDGDDDHVVTLYRRNGYWGAISKTNHAVLRFRDPVHKTFRELALSYFHEYFLNSNGKKVLVSYSAKPFDLRRLGSKWITTEEDLYPIAEAIDEAPHKRIYPAKNKKFLRPADKMERCAGRIIEWKKSNPRT
ncbi:MAG: hypothetical protein WC457_03215 [Patescibacteria group bacterium]